MQLSIPDSPTKPFSYEEKFREKYERLNIRQKEAVDTLQGPVLVVAGPGTGKTQVLSVRIANLLRNTDDQIAPYNILCLTYTDNAAGEMHHRLTDMIGPAAHGLKICTFHAFCNDVIQAHPQFFGRQQLELVTDLEYATFMEQMLDALPVDHVLKKLKGKLSFDASRLKSLFEFMKREDVLVEDMQQRILEYIDDLPNRDEFIYKRNTTTAKKGDLKVAAIRDEEQRMRELFAAAELYHEFEKIMRRNRRYDYADMILWVIDAFKKNPDLAAPYREQYRYILVDEYQDTSGAQNEILQLLTDDDDDYANVFCVGDDDQSIYEFQGARIRNILDFATRYEKNLRNIVLVDNYRSTQQVLDCSRSVIDNNKMRLVSQLDGLVKNLHAVLPERLDTEAAPQLLSFENQMHEEAWIASKIETLIKEGTPADEIAVLYKNHRQATNLIEYFAKSKIPYCVKREMNVLEHPLVEQLISLLQYVNDESERPGFADGELFRIMHFRTFNIDPRDLVTMAVQIQENGGTQTWREAVNNTAFLRTSKLHNAKAIERLGGMINKWVIDAHNMPLRLLAERVLTDSGLLASASTSSESMETLEALTTFFTFLQSQSERRSKLSLKDLSDVMRQMEEHSIKLPLVRTAGGAGGVAFNTCHGAKGSEFLHVFLIGCTGDVWDKDGSNSYKFKLPPTVTFAEGESPFVENHRRLFYVAITRAKEHLYITHAREDNSGKTKKPTLYLSETALEDKHETATPEALQRYMFHRMLPTPPPVTISHEAFVRERVKRMAISPSVLDKFLDCPVSFYYECVLEIPFGKKGGELYGSAVHHALQHLFMKMKSHPQKQFPPLTELLADFEFSFARYKDLMEEKDYRNRIALGHKVLTDYYNDNVASWNKNALVEYNVKPFELENILITGRIDKLEQNDDGTLTAIDYKTETFSNYTKPKLQPANDDDNNGGSYWRQMVFYKILMDHYPQSPGKLSSARIEFVEKNSKTDEYANGLVEIGGNNKQLVWNLIRDAHHKIQNLEFTKGCQQEDCYWCQMQLNNGLVM